MGQHKRNQTAIAAKEGKLEPKKPPIGKREAERILHNRVMNMLFRPWLNNR